MPERQDAVEIGDIEAVCMDSIMFPAAVLS